MSIQADRENELTYLQTHNTNSRQNHYQFKVLPHWTDYTTSKQVTKTK